MPHSKRREGFTLLELTCALFVITVAGFGALQLYSTAMDRIVDMRDYDVAAEILRNEIETLRALPFNEIHDHMAARSGTPALESLHKPELTVAVRPGAYPALKEVTVTLRWQVRQGRQVTRALTTLLADRTGGVQP